MMGSARSNSCSVGRAGSGGDGCNNRAVVKKSTAPSAPTEARKKRGASAAIAKRHHNSLEYSTCLNEKNPSQMDPINASEIAEIQPKVNGSFNKEALR